MVVLTRLGPPEDGIHHAEASTTVYVNDKSLGAGKLYISEARVSWVGDQEQGFSLEYPHIAMHAIHKNAAEFPRPNLYLIIDVRLVDSDGTPTPESSHHGSDNEDEGDPDPGITEIRFVPANDASLQAMFDAMSKCQSLHPDPADSGDDEEVEGEGEEGEEEGMYDDAEEEEEGEGAAEEENGSNRPANGGGGEPMDQ